MQDAKCIEERQIATRSAPAADEQPCQSPPPFMPRTLDELLSATPNQIAACDFARMALLCAEGLPGAEDVTVEKYLRILDAWVVRIRRTIKSNACIFDLDPTKYGFSKAKHKMSIIAAVLQQEYRVGYQREKIGKTRQELPDEVWYRNSRDFMLHGVLGGSRAGTCASLPTLLVSIARRLGFPVNQVLVPQHMICRWDDPATRETFNLDWNGDGIGNHPEEYYHNWPVKWAGWMHESQKQLKVFLRSLTPSESLSQMLSERGACLEANGRREDALATYDVAARLFPNHYAFGRRANEICQKMCIRPAGFAGGVTWGLTRPSRVASIDGLSSCAWGSSEPLVNGMWIRGKIQPAPTRVSQNNNASALDVNI